MPNLRLLTLCAWGLALAAAATAQNANPRGVIYGTQLENGWTDWSWAKSERGLEIEGSARKPIRVEAGPYQALYFHHDAMALTGFTKLRFLLQGSKAGGQVKVLALSAGKPINDGVLFTLKSDGWTDVQLPLDKLGTTDKQVDGIWIQNAGGEALPPFYVTEVQLL